MAEPHTMHLVRTEDISLIPDSPVSLYWTGELQDEGNEHGAGNKTIAYENTDFIATVYLALEALGVGDYVSVYPVLEGGAEANLGPVVDLFGPNNGGNIHTQSWTFSGRVPAGKQLVVRVVNRGTGDVLLPHARLTMLTWPA